jgi:hypothetical protein
MHRNHKRSIDPKVFSVAGVRSVENGIVPEMTSPLPLPFSLTKRSYSGLQTIQSFLFSTTFKDMANTGSLMAVVINEVTFVKCLEISSSNAQMQILKTKYSG